MDACKEDELELEARDGMDGSTLIEGEGEDCSPESVLPVHGNGADVISNIE